MRAATRGRSIAVVTLIVAAGSMLMISAQPWLSVSVVDEPFLVTGAQAVAVLQPITLVQLALSLVLALVGRVLRYVLGVLAIGGGGVLGYLTWGVLVSPGDEHIATAMAEHTGLTGTGLIDQVSSVTVTGWPIAALGAAVLIVAAGIWTLATAARWQRGGKRYDATAGAAAADGDDLDAIDSWDDLSRGTDPTRSAAAKDDGAGGVAP